MAPPQSILSLLLILISSALFLLPLSNGLSFLRCGFNQIYQLGDSLADTGNLIRELPNGPLYPYGRFPYGESIGIATGRCSNGLLIIDYFALSSGLPFLNPYLNKGAYFGNGVNFAVAGATALTGEFLASKGIIPLLGNSTLSAQLDWMSEYFNSTSCTLFGCKEKLKRSLFIVGEIGGNDINYALLEGKTIAEVQSIVPNIVSAITDAVTKVITYGAVRVIVPGNWAFGCFPIYLTQFQTNDTSAYDKNGCLKNLNDLSMYFNAQLQAAILQLQKKFPHAFIAYGDYYTAFLQLLNTAPALGINVATIQKSCCGIGGKYNFDLALECGAAGVPVCANPFRSIYWDGIHLTQVAYQFIAGRLIDDIVPKLGCYA